MLVMSYVCVMLNDRVGTPYVVAIADIAVSTAAVAGDALFKFCRMHRVMGSCKTMTQMRCCRGECLTPCRDTRHRQAIILELYLPPHFRSIMARSVHALTPLQQHDFLKTSIAAKVQGACGRQIEVF